MKKQVFYIHGGSAYTEYQYFLDDLKNREFRHIPDVAEVKKWPSMLRSSLGSGYQVFMPSMPNSDNAKYEEWKIWFERHRQFLHNELVLVGWSQGGSFLARYMSEHILPVTVKSLILLAAPITPGDFGGEDGGDFSPHKAKIPLLQNIAEQIFILHSTDDFVVPYEHALMYKAALPEAELVTFTDKNHFLVAELPELIALIKGLE